MTTETLAEWARSAGATPDAARVLARVVVSRWAGRPVTATPSRRMLARVEQVFDDAIPDAEQAVDPDGTLRFAVRLGDGAVVETVVIPHPRRTTVCLSTQVGCARACVFCETGRLGLLRQLRTEEISGQFAAVARHLRASRAELPTNVVFMGMGEPLDNLEAVLRAADVLSDDNGFAVAARRITISTVGIVPRMHDVYAHGRYQLAVSLHAANDADRRALLPAAMIWDLGELRAAIAAAPRTVLLQWTLIAGRNDSERHADELVRFAAGLDVRVNLIPLNPVTGDGLRAPQMSDVRAFQTRLLTSGIRTMVRLPHGQEIGGACGQLAGALRR
jgi:23S rRNA (adenine2503-C2)-methyltransferase